MMKFLKRLFANEGIRYVFFGGCTTLVNQLYVFKSRTASWKELLAEAAQFIGMRLGTMFLEVFGVIFFSCVWGLNDMLAKLVIQVVVLALNYLFSKFFVFSREKKALTKQEERVRNIQRKCCFWGFLIPAMTVAASFAGNGVFPFGDHGVLIKDSLHR